MSVMEGFIKIHWNETESPVRDNQSDEDLNSQYKHSYHYKYLG